MSFNQLGLISIVANETVTVGFHFGFGADFGAQWANAHPELQTGEFPQFGVFTLQVNDHQKQCIFSAETGSQLYFYSCSVKNISKADTHFSLQGGGVI